MLPPVKAGAMRVAIMKHPRIVDFKWEQNFSWKLIVFIVFLLPFLIEKGNRTLTLAHFAKKHDSVK
jgi:hypothetical protein